MPESSSQQDFLLAIRDLAARVLSAWDFYNDPSRMIVPISDAVYPDLERSINALQAAMDEMSLIHPELTPWGSRFNVKVDPHAGWSDEPVHGHEELLARLREAFPGAIARDER